jgi:uncharacterized protein
MPLAKTLLRNGIVVVAAALALMGLSACDDEPNSSAGPSPENRQVTVVGQGQVQGSPDTLSISLSIEATAPDATAAMNQASDRAKAVIDALVNDAKIDRKDINTTTVNLQQQFGPDSTTITGYRASNSLAIKVRKLDTASETLALITTTGGNSTRINGVNYSIDDDSKLVKDARANAFNDAKARADQYAQLSGLRLGKVISISETGATTPPPGPLQGPRAGAEAVPLEPGQQTVSFSVTVVWELT